jgi:hypothetical protein
MGAIKYLLSIDFNVHSESEINVGKVHFNIYLHIHKIVKPLKLGIQLLKITQQVKVSISS